MLAHLPPDGVLLDIGANIGWFTLLAADQLARADQGGRVIAIEANPSVIPFLCASVVESGLSSRVDIKPYAVSREAGLVAFDSGDVGNLGGQRIKRIQDAVSNRRHIAPAVRLDDLLCDLDRLDVIKIDIEGSEPLALLGGAALIERFRPVIIAEINASALSDVSGIDPKSFIEIMRNLGYQPFDLSVADGAAVDTDEVCAAVEQRGYCDFLFKPIASDRK
jgi:FkbM family methyltransferase